MHHQAMSEWTSQANPGLSTGFMKCDALGTSHQVVFRCPCADAAACGEEEEAVKKLLAKGEMPMQQW